MKVTIVDPLSPQVVKALEGMELEVQNCVGQSADTLHEVLSDTDILVVRSTKVQARAIESAKNLSLIIRAGAGVDNIDLVSASSRGIYVANCPGKNTAAVAELTIGLLVAADRRIVDASQAMRQGKWMKKEYGKSRGLAGRTFGLLGFGSIGRAVAARALAMEMDVLVWSRSLTDEQAESYGVRRVSDPMDIAQCDAVSVHLAYAPETKHFVGAPFFAAMKPGSIFLNTSRGSLVDTHAMRKAVADKKLRVGLDVFEDEPSGGEAPWHDLEYAASVTCTPHIGASTDQASEAIAAEVVRIVEQFLRTSQAPGTVNLSSKSAARHQLVVRHYNRVGVLAAVLDGLRSEGINVEEVENRIFAGGVAASCSMVIDRIPSDSFLVGLRQNDNILHALCNPGEDS